MLARRLDSYSDEDLFAYLSGLISTAEPEHLRLDYKRETDLSKDRWKREAAKDVTAFANSVGGLLVYGVAEDSSTHAPDGSPPGFPYPPDFEDRLLQVLTSAILPRPYNLSVRRLETETGALVLVQVPESPSKPHAISYDHRYYVRNGRESRPMSEHEVEAAYRERARLAARPQAAADSLWVRGILHDRPSTSITWASHYLAVPLLASPEPAQYWAFRGLSGGQRPWRAAPAGVETEREWERQSLELGGRTYDVAWPEEYYTLLDDGTFAMWEEATFIMSPEDSSRWDWNWPGEASRLDHFFRLSSAFWRRMHCAGPVSLTVHPSIWDWAGDWPAIKLAIKGKPLVMQWPVDSWEASLLSSTDEIESDPAAVSLRMLKALFRFFGEEGLPAGFEKLALKAISQQRGIEGLMR